MFTGLVEDIGTVVRVSPNGHGKRLVIRTALPLGEVKVGDSISTNGVCLTAEQISGDTFVATAGVETLQASTLGSLRAADSVHLERALALGDRLGGHLVQGHVDGVGRVVRISDASESWIIWIEVPYEITRYIAQKGSITLNGVSLTVNELTNNRLRVNIVPHTVKTTLLGQLRPNSTVNIEVDVLAKYVESLLNHRTTPSTGLTIDKLASLGFQTTRHQ